MRKAWALQIQVGLTGRPRSGFSLKPMPHNVFLLTLNHSPAGSNRFPTLAMFALLTARKKTLSDNSISQFWSPTDFFLYIEAWLLGTTWMCDYKGRCMNKVSELFHLKLIPVSHTKLQLKSHLMKCYMLHHANIPLFETPNMTIYFFMRNIQWGVISLPYSLAHSLHPLWWFSTLFLILFLA